MKNMDHFRLNVIKLVTKQLKLKKNKQTFYQHSRNLPAAGSRQHSSEAAADRSDADWSLIRPSREQRGAAGLLPEAELKLQVRVQEPEPAPLICTVGLVASHQITASFQSAQRGDDEAADVTLNFSCF